MTYQEMSDRFDVLFNNITSNQAPGLNEYEKSVVLTKAQDEILKNQFNPKGNKYQEGFDDSQKRQMDFSMLIKKASPNVSSGSSNFYPGSTGVGTTTIPNDVWLIINERMHVTRNRSEVDLTVVPISFDEFDRLMSKPYKRPLKYQAWRLITNENKSTDIVVGPSDTFTNSPYTIRYVRKPKPIIVGDLDGLTINGYEFSATTSAEPTTNITGKTAGCELDEMLHEEILQRAVELAKVAWTQTGQDNLNAVLQAGQRSE